MTIVQHGFGTTKILRRVKMANGPYSLERGDAGDFEHRFALDTFQRDFGVDMAESCRYGVDIVKGCGVEFEALERERVVDGECRQIFQKICIEDKRAIEIDRFEVGVSEIYVE